MTDQPFVVLLGAVANDLSTDRFLQIGRDVRRVLVAWAEVSDRCAPVVLRKKSVRDEFVNKNLRETLDCSH